VHGRNGSEAGGVSEAITEPDKKEIEKLRPEEFVDLARPYFLWPDFLWIGYV
jgi:hypothetical protein